MSKQKSSSKSSSAYTSHNKVHIVRGGVDYFKTIEEMADGAKDSLHLQTYIFDEDETGKLVAAALIRAAQRKVSVYVLLDGYASQNLSEAFTDKLKHAGVHFGFFEPLLKSRYFYFGRRMHHKIVVADSRVCMVAGINVGDRYNDVREIKPWLDWAVCAEGEAAGQINEVCIKVWNGSVLRKKCIAVDHTPHPFPADICLVRVRRNDWVHKKTEITKSYRELFQEANRSVTLMTSYFWPPQKLLRRMGAAARRGVKIRIILTAKADVPFAKYAERHLYSWLLRRNIEVYEYHASILHGKIAVCDDEVVTIGSYNVNNISAFASMELNLDIKNVRIAADLTDRLNGIISGESKQITNEDVSSVRNIVKRFFYYLSFRLIHIVFFLFTFYFRQRSEHD
jgi:cardiolipin synthase A/B